MSDAATCDDGASKLPRVSIDPELDAFAREIVVRSAAGGLLRSRHASPGDRPRARLPVRPTVGLLGASAGITGVTLALRRTPLREDVTSVPMLSVGMFTTWWLLKEFRSWTRSRAGVEQDRILWAAHGRWITAAEAGARCS